MRKAISILLTGVIFMLGFWALMPDSRADAQRKLRYSRSAQVAEAFGKEGLAAFTRKTGIQVEAYTSSSATAVARVMNGFSDIASTTRRLYPRHRERGYEEFPFCKDPLTVIINPKNQIRDISDVQLREIFGGRMPNWKELGGPGQPIIVVVPGKDTGAYKNFRRLVMGRKEISYDFMTYKSIFVIDVVERFPWAISFITRGATFNRGPLKTIKINGLLPEDDGYPYYQTFSFVLKADAPDIAKALVDFVLSEEGKAIIKKRGMCPMPCPKP